MFDSITARKRLVTTVQVIVGGALLSALPLLTFVFRVVDNVPLVMYTDGVMRLPPDSFAGVWAMLMAIGWLVEVGVILYLIFKLSETGPYRLFYACSALVTCFGPIASLLHWWDAPSGWYGRFIFDGLIIISWILFVITMIFFASQAPAQMSDWVNRGKNDQQLAAEKARKAAAAKEARLKAVDSSGEPLHLQYSQTPTGTFRNLPGGR